MLRYVALDESRAHQAVLLEVSFDINFQPFLQHPIGSWAGWKLQQVVVQWRGSGVRNKPIRTYDGNPGNVTFLLVTIEITGTSWFAENLMAHPYKYCYKTSS